MRWLRRRSRPVILSRGIAIVPDGFDVALTKRLAGPNVDVYTISEWLDTLEEEMPL